MPASFQKGFTPYCCFLEYKSDGLVKSQKCFLPLDGGGEIYFLRIHQDWLPELGREIKAEFMEEDPDLKAGRK